MAGQVHNYIGNPDGLNENLGNFLQIHQSRPIDFKSLVPRVLVGRKGSGKSFTLRMFAEEARKSTSSYVVTLEQEPPDLNSLIKFTAPMNATSRTNTWQKIWECAVSMTILSHVFLSDDFSSRFVVPGIEQYRHEYKRSIDLFGELEYPVTVYDSVSLIINQFGFHEAFINFYNSYQFLNIKGLLLKVLNNCPDFCIYIDCLDDELRRAPSIIIDITRALFYHSIHCSRFSDSRKNIHIVTTVRDIVYSTIMTSEHGPRYRDIEQVRELPWTPPMTEHFLQEKVEIGLKSNGFLPQSANLGPAALKELLGFDEIDNLSKGHTEQVSQYIIRHTNCIPRTIVSLGNRLFNLKEKGELGEQEFRDEVNATAREEASTLVKVASAYIVSSLQGADVAFILDGQKALEEYLKNESDFNDRTIGSIVDSPHVSLTDGFVRPIISFIECVGKDVFSRQELEDALSLFIESEADYRNLQPEHQFGSLENVLWAQGLIGVRRKAKSEFRDEFFFFGRPSREPSLPKNADEYVFFPGLNSLCNLAVQPGQAVGSKYTMG